MDKMAKAKKSKIEDQESLPQSGEEQVERMIAEEQLDDKDRLELQTLRAKVEQLEEEKKNREEGSETEHIKEIELLRRKSKTNLNEIKYKEIVPEFISLWHVAGHNIGKRVGPIMLEQAEETYLRFRTVGIKLSAVKPTEEAIARYKQTDEFKRLMALEDKRRAGKEKSRKESEVDKLTKAISAMTGIASDKLNVISQEGDVKNRSTGLLNQVEKVK